MAGKLIQRLVTMRTYICGSFLLPKLSQSQCCLCTTATPAGVPTTCVTASSEDEKLVLPAIQQAEILLETNLRSKTITTLAELVKFSADLQRLVLLGVSLKDVEAQEGACDLLAKINYYPDVDDVVKLLGQVGVTDFGQIITRCPFLLAEGVQNIKLKLIYFSSRKFSRDQIARIVTFQPKLLLMEVSEIDLRLQNLQQDFKFSDRQLREVVSNGPRIVRTNPLIIQKFRLMMTNEYYCNEGDLRNIVIGCPASTRLGEHSLRNRMGYLTETMGLTLHQVIAWPRILTCRERILAERHEILAHLKLARYKNTEPNYVSLPNLVSGSDAEFCEKVAKIPLELYYDFLKTL